MHGGARHSTRMGDTPHTYACMTDHVHMDKGHPRPYPGHIING